MESIVFAFPENFLLHFDVTARFYSTQYWTSTSVIFIFFCYVPALSTQDVRD